MATPKKTKKTPTTTKKAAGTRTRKTISKTTSRTRKASSTAKKHIVDAKLNRVMDEQTGTATTKSSITRKKTGFPWWGLVAFVLLLAFGGILLYENNDDFRSNLNQMLNATGLVAVETESKSSTPDVGEPFNLKLTIVFNKEDAYMKDSIDQYLNNLDQNLVNTTVDATWIDKTDEKGKALIEKLDAKYLPLFTTEASIKTHPQYQLFGGAVKEKAGEYVFQSEGMEYLQVPPVGDATYLGANPTLAKVVIVEYTSFSCGYCKAMHLILERVVEKYGRDVSLVIKHYDRGGVDLLLAQAAECANDQGRFSQMLTALYDNQSDFFTAMQDVEDPKTAVDNLLRKVAGDSGANADSIMTCVDEGTYAKTVMDNTLEGSQFGVMGTPSFFINNKFVGGATDENVFVQLVEEELNK
jgi:protein-disulfide isomerase